AGGARSGRAVVLALQGDAEAFFLLGSHRGIGFGLGQRSSSGKRRKRGRHGAGEDERGDGKFGRHGIFLSRWHRLASEERIVGSLRTQLMLPVEPLTSS